MPRVLAMAILVASIGCVDLLNGATCSKDGDCGDYICESGRCTEPSDLTTNEDGTGSPDRGTNTGSRDAGTTSNNNQCLPGGEDCGAGTVLGLT